jgi:GNAT superfamily N-acetyltransferase
MTPSAYADGTDLMTETTASTIEVTRTYLEMRAPADLQPAHSNDQLIRIELQRNCSVDLFRLLYREVGRNYYWTDRLPWTDQEIRAYLDQPNVSLWLMTYDGETAGYFELKKDDNGATEIAYFGLIPEFIGRGLGKHLLTRAVEEAWARGATRVWLHTCTDDDPAALPNYRKRGFEPFRTETYTVER